MMTRQEIWNDSGIQKVIDDGVMDRSNKSLYLYLTFDPADYDYYIDTQWEKFLRRLKVEIEFQAGDALDEIAALTRRARYRNTRGTNKAIAATKAAHARPIREFRIPEVWQDQIIAAYRRAADVFRARA